jgi:cell fate regulator YaaT (PSP1 superfamily)
LIEIVSIKFKSGGKSYYFSPGNIRLTAGTRVIVETAKGLEIAECVKGNHMVEDTSVVQPLRPVVRIATAQDLQTDEQNRIREKEAFVICQKKIEAHGLDMKLVDVECSFDGSKTLFFFTSDGRVDFRDLVKDLAGIFHNRIELRQIGVRDEAKMLGGIGICGRPYCCSSFLSDFAPVSTKMAKIQNLSLNPTTISGSCGRLMCCLRFEESAYEDLVKHVPKAGAFVETTEGYGNAVSVDLLKQQVKVHLDGESDDTFHVFKAAEVASVPGGRPKEGEPYPKVLNYIEAEAEPEAPEEDPWEVPSLFAETQPEQATDTEEAEQVERPEGSRSSRRHRPPRRPKKKGKTAESSNSEIQAAAPEVKPSAIASPKQPHSHHRHSTPEKSPSEKEKKTLSVSTAAKPASEQAESAPKKKSRRKFYPRRRKKSSGGSADKP